MLKLKSDESLITWGVTYLLLGVGISLLLGFLTGTPDGLLQVLFLSLVFAAAMLAWGTDLFKNNVPTGNRGVVKGWGTKRIEAGPGDAGLEEGLNCLPVGKPFLVVEFEPAFEFKLEFSGLKVRTKDLAPFMVGGFLMVKKVLPHIYQGVKKNTDGSSQAETSLQEMSDQALRDVSCTYDDSKTFATANKLDLSDKVEADLRKLLRDTNNGDERRWGLYVEDLEITSISADEDVEKSWKQVPIQKALGEAENLEAARRKQQAKEFIELKVDPNVALNAALVNANKTGARTNNISLEGLDEVGKGLGAGGAGLGRGFAEGLGKLAEAIKAWAEK